MRRAPSFDLTTIVEMPRGLTDDEVVRFLVENVLPGDQDEPVDDDNVNDDNDEEPVIGEGDARSLLAGIPVGAFIAAFDPGTVDKHWREQLRAPKGTPIGGQWVESIGGVIRWITAPGAKNAKGAVIYRKGQSPGDTVAVRADGGAVVRVGSSGNFEVHSRKSGSWQRESTLPKKAAYDRVRGQTGEEWREPDVRPFTEGDDENEGFVESRQVEEVPTLEETSKSIDRVRIVPTKAVFRKNITDGEIITEDEAGTRVYWDASRKKFIFTDRSGAETDVLSKNQTYQRVKSGNWYEPGEIPEIVPSTSEPVITPSLDVISAIPTTSANTRNPEVLEDYRMIGAAMNRALRVGVADVHSAKIERLDTLLAESSLTSDITVWRGLRDPKKVFGDSWPDNGNATGLTWTDAGYGSTSVNEVVARDFAGTPDHDPVIIRVTAPAGMGAAFISGSESEVVLPRGLTYRVTRDNGTDDTDRRYLDVEVMSEVSPIEVETPQLVPEPEPTAPAYEGPRYVLPDKFAGRQSELDELKRLWSLRAEMHKPGIPTSQESLDLSGKINALENALELHKHPELKSRIAQEHQINDELKLLRERVGLLSASDDDEVRANLVDRTREAFAGKKVAVRVTPSNLEKILTDGRFKSQFESDSSKGLKNINMRANLEAAWFGLPYTPSWAKEQDFGDPTIRPIYGYVALDGVRPTGISTGEIGGVSTDALSQYGQIQVVLKEDVRRRTTAMFGDSLNNMHQGRPSPIDDPDWQSFTPIGTSAIVNAGLRDLNRDPLDREFRANTYAEAQVHGGVTLDDVEEVVFPSTPPKATRDLLDAKGVSWRVLNLKTAVEGTPDERATALRVAEQDLVTLGEQIALTEEQIIRFPTEDYLKKDLKKLQSQLKIITGALPALRTSTTQAEESQPVAPAVNTSPLPAAIVESAPVAPVEPEPVEVAPESAPALVLGTTPDTTPESALTDFYARITAAVSGREALDQTSLSAYSDLPEVIGGVEADDVYTALNDYTAQGYMNINDVLRLEQGKTTGASKTTKSHIRAIDALLGESSLTSDVVVYRGVRNPGVVFGDAWSDDDVAGMEWIDHSYASTSTDPGIAQRFTSENATNAVVMRILTPLGHSAVMLSREEQEILLDRGTRFRVVRDNGVSDGARRLDVEVLT